MVRISVTLSVKRRGIAIELPAMQTGLRAISVHSMTPITSCRLQILKATSFPGRVAARAAPSREYLPVGHRAALDQCTPRARRGPARPPTKCRQRPNDFSPEKPRLMCPVASCWCWCACSVAMVTCCIAGVAYKGRCGVVRRSSSPAAIRRCGGVASTEGTCRRRDTWLCRRDATNHVLVDVLISYTEKSPNDLTTGDVSRTFMESNSLTVGLHIHGTLSCYFYWNVIRPSTSWHWLWTLSNRLSTRQ